MDLTPDDYAFAKKCWKNLNDKSYTLKEICARLNFSYSAKTLWHSKSFQKLLSTQVFSVNGVNMMTGEKKYDFDSDKMLDIILDDIGRSIGIHIRGIIK